MKQGFYHYKLYPYLYYDHKGRKHYIYDKNDSLVSFRIHKLNNIMADQANKKYDVWYRGNDSNDDEYSFERFNSYIKQQLDYLENKGKNY